jgi:hypothetical protein
MLDEEFKMQCAQDRARSKKNQGVNPGGPASAARLPVEDTQFSVTHRTSHAASQLLQ